MEPKMKLQQLQNVFQMELLCTVHTLVISSFRNTFFFVRGTRVDMLFIYESEYLEAGASLGRYNCQSALQRAEGRNASLCSRN